MGQTATAAREEDGVDIDTDTDTDVDTDHDSFDSDGLLDEPAPEQGGGISLTDLRDGMKRAVIGLINMSASAKGSELEISTTLRCPIEPPLFISGKGALKVSRAMSGAVTVSMSGAFGPSLGDGMGLYGDLFATASLQGTGANPERALDMLSLALENHLRSYYDRSLWQAVYDNWLTLVVSPGQGILTVVLETGSAAAIADAIWGKGHMKTAMDGMKDGESAQLQRGVAVGGSMDAPATTDGPSVGVEGTVGVVDQERIEKRPGTETKAMHSPVLVVAGKGSVAFAGCGFEIQAPLNGDKGGFMKISGKATGLPAEIGQMANWSSALIGVLSAGREAIMNAPEGSGLTGIVSDLLSLETIAEGTMAGFQDQLIKDLSVKGLKNKIGIEMSATVDFVTGVITIQYLYVNGSEQKIPGDSKAGVTAKSVIGPVITIKK